MKTAKDFLKEKYPDILPNWDMLKVMEEYASQWRELYEAERKKNEWVTITNKRLMEACHQARIYFGENDKTMAQHVLYAILDNAIKNTTVSTKEDEMEQLKWDLKQEHDEYLMAVKEIRDLSDRLKDAEKEIMNLNNEIRNR